MPVWSVTPAHADLLASAYLDRVDPSVDPQDMGTAFLTDSLQGVQVDEGRQLPSEWLTIERYAFQRVPTETRQDEIEAASALVSDTARAACSWYETDTQRWLSELSRASRN